MYSREKAETKLKEYLGKDISEASVSELYSSLFNLINEAAGEKTALNRKKILYYFSAEFLIGKLLSNNLINLGLYDTVKTILKANGKNLSELEEFENEPSLGNGGLGRLASCFLDSLASLNLQGDGIGLRYHYGLFRQEFKDGKQYETKDEWLTDNSWAHPTDVCYDVELAGKSYKARMYELYVTGYEGRTNTLRLFDIDSIDESIVKKGISFDKKDISKNLTLFLYPDDSDEEGRKLRIYQQYFMVSAGAQYILENAVKRGSNLYDLAEYVAVQINDTHPSMVIPELIRLLEKRGIAFENAISIVTDVCGFTNHTILSEALEKWPMSYLEEIAAPIVPVIKKLDENVRSKIDDESTYIIDNTNTVHMAHMDIHFTHSINGVAALHSQILKNTELNNFYNIYPYKFNNKTNGITFRRWLIECNPLLTAEIENLIGSDFKKNANDLSRLLYFERDMNVLKSFYNIKKQNKQNLIKWLNLKQHIYINPNAIFCIQSKRLHEYKRQQLNLLYLIHLYQRIITDNYRPPVPICCIFGAKAAPAYTIAKDIIHALITLKDVVEKDPLASKWLQIVFVENYNVTAAEKMIPACDLSEQISLASKEASGTGNMKFMLNGALTLGTLDGANVEIAQKVGRENIYIFGESSDTVINKYKTNIYRPMDYYENDMNIRNAIDFLTGPEMMQQGTRENLERLKNEILNKDYFQTLPDFNAYVVRKTQAIFDYANDPLDWSRRCLVNIANSGYFSSDRTISEYNNEIWHL